MNQKQLCKTKVCNHVQASTNTEPTLLFPDHTEDINVLPSTSAPWPTTSTAQTATATVSTQHSHTEKEIRGN